jgi:hypothetical protein
MSPAAVYPGAVSLNDTTYHQEKIAKQDVAAQNFDPSVHLAYSPPVNTLNMEELGHRPTELSSVAHTEPFQLLSYEGVLAHRREIFSEETLENCLHHTRPGSVQIRGMAPRYGMERRYAISLWRHADIARSSVHTCVLAFARGA